VPAHILDDVQRVSVVGNSGSGKTTIAAALSAALNAPHLELDSVFHQPGWVPLEEQEFRRRVAEFVAAPSWVADGNYSAVQDLVWGRADTVIWLDLPRHRVMPRIIWRTLRRAALRAELWNGNRERWTNLVSLDPIESVIVWSWTQHHKYRQRYQRAVTDPANAHLAFVRLRTPGQVAALIARVRAQAAPPRETAQDPG
jgi:adenylate kinase family enzyme